MEYNNALRLGCIIMASGLGRRFGSNKLIAGFGGRPMICSILTATEGLFDRRIVVTRHAEVRDICTEYRAEVLLHDLPHRSDTVRLGLQALKGNLDGCMFCAGDQPLLGADSIRRLICAFAREPGCIWRLGGGIPAIFPVQLFDELMHLPEGHGGREVMRRHAELMRSVEPVQAWELLDADTPEMLRSLEKHLKQ